jgi:hypothetical protein
VSKKQHRLLSTASVRIFDELRGILMSNIEGLPLIVESVGASASQLRYTSLLPLTPHPFLDGDKLGRSDKEVDVLVTPLELVMTVESSGKWPIDTIALEKTKLAVLLKFGQLLTKQYSLKTVIREELATLDVAFKGYLFRVKLNTVHDNEIKPLGLSRNQIISSFVSPLHHSNIHNLASKFPSYSGTVSLLKYWVDSKNFSGHLSSEAIELIAAHAYLSNDSLVPPATPSLGFRVALKLIAEYRWDEYPLYLDFTEGQLSSRQSARAAVLEVFAETRRESKYSCRMFITSSAERYVGFQPAFSFQYPENVVLRMLVVEARETLIFFKNFMASSLQGSLSGQSIDEAFEPRGLTRNYNVILKFNSNLFRDSNGSPPVFSKTKVYKNLQDSNSLSINTLIARYEFYTNFVET